MTDEDRERLRDIFKRYQLATKLGVGAEYSEAEIRLYEEHNHSVEYAALWDEVAEEHNGEKVDESWANWSAYQEYKEQTSERCG